MMERRYSARVASPSVTRKRAASATNAAAHAGPHGGFFARQSGLGIVAPDTQTGFLGLWSPRKTHARRLPAIRLTGDARGVRCVSANGRARDQPGSLAQRGVQVSN